VAGAGGITLPLAKQEVAMTGRMILATMLCLTAGAAYADSIDGNWCNEKGARRMSIAGPSIVTPSGAHTTGDYTRHAFSYVVPAGDPGAGTMIRMLLMGEEHVQVQEGGATPVIWNRCGPSIS
jgi:hypothetical protein